MFSRQSQTLLKRLFKGPPPTAFKTFYPALNKNYLKFCSIYSFSSFQQQSFSRTTDYQAEFPLLTTFSREDLAKASKVMEKYSHCEDFGVLTSDEVDCVSLVLRQLANAHKKQENHGKAFLYLREEEAFLQKVGLRDTYHFADNYHIQACMYLEQGKSTEAEYYLNEVDRICRLFPDDSEMKSLMLQSWNSLAQVSMYSDPDNSLKLYNSILERLDDIREEVLPNILIGAHIGMGDIYSERQDINKTLEYWTKGLEIATKYFGINSQEAFFFSDRTTRFLSEQGQAQRALPHAKQALEIALKVFFSRKS